MNKKIFITREIPQVGIEMLKQKGFELTIWPKDRAPKKKEIISIIKKGNFDGVLCLLTDTIDKEVIDATTSVKIFANYATGYNNIDIVEARNKNIVITNTPNVSAKAVAEHAIALMLSLTTRTTEGDKFMRKGKYKGWSPMDFIGTDLCGKTLGLIGVGNIGSEVARMAYTGFGTNVIYYDVNPNKEIEDKYQAKKCASVEELLADADIVSLHVPLLESTHHLINEKRLKLMKPTAFLINTSRGPVIDEVALVKALENKIIRGAGLDVFEFEPKLSKGLIKLDNVVLTPHIASARESVRNDMAKIAAQNIIDFFDGKTPTAKVN